VVVTEVAVCPSESTAYSLERAEISERTGLLHRETRHQHKHEHEHQNQHLPLAASTVLCASPQKHAGVVCGSATPKSAGTAICSILSRRAAVHLCPGKAWECLYKHVAKFCAAQRCTYALARRGNVRTSMSLNFVPRSGAPMPWQGVGMSVQACR